MKIGEGGDHLRQYIEQQRRGGRRAEAVPGGAAKRRPIDPAQSEEGVVLSEDLAKGAKINQRILIRRSVDGAAGVPLPARLELVARQIVGVEQRQAACCTISTRSKAAANSRAEPRSNTQAWPVVAE